MRDFLALTLSVFYATYVITRSAFPPVRYVRDQILDRTEEKSSLAYLVTCPWCTGFWIAAITVLVACAVLPDGVAHPVFMVLAAAGVTGVLQHLVDVLEKYEDMITPKPAPEVTVEVEVEPGAVTTYEEAHEGPPAKKTTTTTTTRRKRKK